jgi:hypothetical protein
LKGIEPDGGPFVRRAACLALMLSSLAGCRAYNSNNPYPKDRPAPPSSESGSFPITRSFINNAVERDSPNLR